MGSSKRTGNTSFMILSVRVNESSSPSNCRGGELFFFGYDAYLGTKNAVKYFVFDRLSTL